MATSGSVDFTTNRDELIKDALLLIGELGEEEEPTAFQIAYGSRVLNKMAKAWQAHGLQLWKILQATVTPVTGDYQYTLGATGQVVMNRPLRIIDAYRRETSTATDIVLTKMTREEYFDLTDKDVQGTPVNFYYDPQTPNGTMHIWPAPDSSFASKFTLQILYHSPTEDFDNALDEADYPQEWLEAITYGLAVRLAPGTGLTVTERRLLQAEAQVALDLAMSFDVEDGSVFFQPDNRGIYHDG